MTGPEHYREAERIITAVSAGELDESILDRDQLLIAAQVHALLASAAATAVGGLVTILRPGAKKLMADLGLGQEVAPPGPGIGEAVLGVAPYGLELL